MYTVYNGSLLTAHRTLCFPSEYICIFQIYLYSCLILQFMCFYRKRLFILIVSLCILIVVYVFMLLSMYS